LKGLGIGLSGALFQSGEALFMIPGYAMKDLYHKLHGRRSHVIEDCLGKLRRTEGIMELRMADEEAKSTVKRLWSEMNTPKES
jgi:hypothetical protein